MKEISIEMEKDIQLLKAIARVGFITPCLLDYLDITQSRLKQHISSGNIVKAGTYMIYGSLCNIYTLTEEAKNRLRSEFLINPYKSDISQLEHDYCLAKVYLHLKYNQKESWKTETQLRMEYPLVPSTTDGMYYTDDNKKIGVEIMTDRYSKEEINNKLDFIRYHCDDYIILHTHKNIKYII